MSLLQPVPEHEREHLDALLDGALHALVTRELLDEADRDAAWRALRLTFDAAYALGDNAHARRLDAQPRPPSASPPILPASAA